MRDFSVFPVFPAHCVASAERHKDGVGLGIFRHCWEIMKRTFHKSILIFQVKVVDLTLIFTFTLFQTSTEMTIKGFFKKIKVQLDKEERKEYNSSTILEARKQVDEW